MKKLRIISIILIMCCGFILIWPLTYDYRTFLLNLQTYKLYTVGVEDRKDNVEYTDDYTDEQKAQIKEYARLSLWDGIFPTILNIISLIVTFLVIESGGAFGIYLTIKKRKQQDTQ